MILRDQNGRLIFQIYNQILGNIYDHGVAKTEKISALNLSEKLGVSRTPVSFALFRMEIEGLLSSDKNGGWIVSPISINELDEIFDIKECLFPIIVETATKKITTDNISKLYIFVDEIYRSIKWNDLNSWRAADIGFNHLLELSSENQKMGYFEQVIDNQLYRVLTSYLSFPNSDKDIFFSYKDIVLAISSGNSLIAKEKALEFIVEIRVILKQFLQDVVIPLINPNTFNRGAKEIINN